MPSIIGLPDTAKFAAESAYFYSHRRRILHSYPAGGAPLTGILSMAESEPVESFEHTWYEDRYHTPSYKTRGTSPLTSTKPSTGDSDSGTAASGSQATSATLYLKISTVNEMRNGIILQSPAGDHQLRVTAVTAGVADADKKGYVTVHPVRAFTYAAANWTAGTTGQVQGSAFGEGAFGAGVTPTPVEIPYAVKNWCQIFRTPMSFPGSVLKQGLKWDASGPYREKANTTIIQHMTSLERQLIWGKRASVNRAGLASGERSSIHRFQGGIIEFLELWDAGSTGITIDGATYAPYLFKEASTTDSDDEKRVIANTDGGISIEKWETWAERTSRYHHNMSSEKLVLCGNTAIKAMASLVRNNTQYQVTEKTTMYGLTFVSLRTPFGDFHFMTHPMFNDNATYRSWCLILDVHSIKLRPLMDRDTELLTNRQNNGDDERKDEYLTEMTMEMWFPERSMLIKNVSSYTQD